jgi:O-antigen/teichoic acid export membrane protein
MSWRERLSGGSAAWTLALGSAFAQAILFLATPVITRLYGPEEYGLFGVFGVVVTLLTPVCGLCLSSALALAEDEAERAALAQTGIATAVLVSAALSLPVALVATEWLTWWSLAVLATVLTVIGQFVYQWDLLQRDFTYAALRTVSGAIVSASSRIGLGFLWPIGNMLAVGQALGLGAAAVGGVRGFDPRKIGWRIDVSLLQKYRDFPVHQSWQQVVNVLSRMLPIPLLAAEFGAAVAGQYTLAMMALGVAGRVIGKSVGDAALPELVAARRAGGSLVPVLTRSTRQLVGWGVAPLMLVMLAGPQIFALVFGAAWREAGEFARWMAPWSFVALLNPPALGVVNVLRLQAWASRLNLMTLMLRGAGLLLGVYALQSALWGVVLFSLGGLVHNLLLILGAFLRARRAVPQGGGS